MNQERNRFKGCCCGCIIPLALTTFLSLAGAYGVYKVIQRETPPKILPQTPSRTSPSQIVPINSKVPNKYFSLEERFIRRIAILIP